MLKQGRRVNKSSAILNKRINFNLILLLIIVQVNVLICDKNPTGGRPEGSGYKKCHRNNLKNEVLILGETIRQNRCFRRKKNVGKLFKKIILNLRKTRDEILRWILIKTTKWKKTIQISLFSFLTFLYSDDALKIIMIYCHTNKNNSHEYIPALSIAPLSLLIVVKIYEVVRCKSLITRWLIWLKIMVSSSKMLSLTIYLELLRQNIKSNPRMSTEKKNSDHNKILSVYLYNSNGLGDKKKLRRILAKVSPIVEKGGVILIQETHLNDTSYLKTIWKYNFVSNCIRTNSAGVIILYNNDYKTLDTFSDEKGRKIIVAIENDDVKLIISNAYFPNDHKEGIVFAEGMYLKILEFQHKFPEHQTIRRR